MRTFYDFEFIEKHGHIDPISAGFVRQDGKELYLVFNTFNTLSVASNEWLMANVMPTIPHREFTSHITGTGQPVKDLEITDGPDVVNHQQARARILEFFRNDPSVELWAWYGSYDHVALCSLFGSMIELPGMLPMLTHDIKSLIGIAGSPKMPQQPDGHHNALDDARFNVVRYNFLIEKINARSPELRRTYILADTWDSATRWLEYNHRHKDSVRVFSDTARGADRLRGVRIRLSDEVIVLGEISEEMRINLHLARR